jgi:prepilin-type N-terminal cleavage/methylation domain-containing protein
LHSSHLHNDSGDRPFSGRSALPRAAHQRGERRGFTLFEIVLVLVVLVTILGITWPSLSRLFAHHQLRQAAELVQVRLTSGRICSLESGLAYQFRFEPGGRRFLLVPFDPEPPQDSAEGNATQRAMRKVGMLPDTASFAADSALAGEGVEIPEEWLSGLPNVADYSGASWSGPVLFYPDGTATDFELVIVGKDQRKAKVTLRGLTGGVSVSSVNDG